MTKKSKITEDTLLDGKVRLSQGKNGYRAAIDPVLLAAAVPAKAGETVLDLGCGGGAASLCLAARVADIKVTGLDVQEPLIERARKNAKLSKLDDAVFFHAGDLQRPPPEVGNHMFDHVMANPPFQKSDTGHPPPDAEKAIANVEGTAGLTDWVAAAAWAVRNRGSVTFVHRADRIDDLMAAFHGVLGEAVIYPLWPGPDKAAKRVIVSARKGVGSPATILPGLVLHDDEGGFSEAANAVLRDAAPLPVRP